MINDLNLTQRICFLGVNVKFLKKIYSSLAQRICFLRVNVKFVTNISLNPLNQINMSQKFIIKLLSKVNK